MASPASSADRHGEAPRLARRDFLIQGSGAVPAVAAAGAGSPDRSPPRPGVVSVIWIVNVGGQSALETWDPKPQAPAEIRGPTRAIPTSVPGIAFAECLPRMARLAHHLAIVRSCAHPWPARHEIGWDLALFGTCGLDRHHRTAHFGTRPSGGKSWPDCAVPNQQADEANPTKVPVVLGEAPGSAAFATWLNRAVGGGRSTLDAPGQGRGAGPVFWDPLRPPSAGMPPSAWAWRTRWIRAWDRKRDRYGRTRLGRLALAARVLVESGVREIVLPAFASLEGASWDAHGGPKYPTVEDVVRHIAPQFDQAMSGLIEDLHERRLLDQTLLCSLSEFGRTARINASGGRDHGTGAWSTMLAGGGVRGGQVIGRTDSWGASVETMPIFPSDLTALCTWARTGCFARPLHLATSERPAAEYASFCQLREALFA